MQAHVAILSAKNFSKEKVKSLQVCKNTSYTTDVFKECIIIPQTKN